MSFEMENGQLKLEEHVERTLYESNVLQKDLINGMMKIEKAGCSFDDKTLTLAFPVQKWQANRIGHLHGGIICTAFDITVGALVRFFAGENFAPTVSLDVKFIRPVKIGDKMLVKAKAMIVGRRISQMTCEAYSENTGKLLASGASVFMSIDTENEKKKTQSDTCINICNNV